MPENAGLAPCSFVSVKCSVGRLERRLSGWFKSRRVSSPELMIVVTTLKLWTSWTDDGAESWTSRPGVAATAIAESNRESMDERENIAAK